MSFELYKQHFIRPNWDAPSNVSAFSTTRLLGASKNCFTAFNLGLHVGDSIQEVKTNRSKLIDELGLKREPFWLEQVHSNKSVACSDANTPPKADASFSFDKNQVCTVMTADCMPILLTNRAGNWVAACHAGWRGLVDGVIENTLANYPSCSSELIAWIGPSISQPFFEVGEEVLQQFSNKFANASQYFENKLNRKFQFDFVRLAKDIMEEKGVAVFGGDLCTYNDNELFYSYRRDGKTGRMASLIWYE